jgi:hypothetical protein
MQLLPTLDDILCRAQRQGRIPFYVRGQEHLLDISLHGLNLGDFRKTISRAGMNASH